MQEDTEKHNEELNKAADEVREAYAVLGGDDGATEIILSIIRHEPADKIKDMPGIAVARALAIHLIEARNMIRQINIALAAKGINLHVSVDGEIPVPPSNLSH